MTSLNKSTVLRKAATSNRWNYERDGCDVWPDNRPDHRSVNLQGRLSVSQGYSDVLLEIDVDDIPTLLAAVGELAGGPRLLAEAASAASARLQDRLRDMSQRLSLATGTNPGSAGGDVNGDLWYARDEAFEVSFDLAEVVEQRPSFEGLQVVD